MHYVIGSVRSGRPVLMHVRTIATPEYVIIERREKLIFGFCTSLLVSSDVKVRHLGEVRVSGANPLCKRGQAHLTTFFRFSV